MNLYVPPTEQEISIATAKLVHPQHMRVFLERLENPYWIKQLREMGAFSDPPQPVRNDVDNTIQYRHWPALTYLRRVVESGIEEPVQIAADVLANIDSDDPFVRSGIVDISVKLPGPLAVTVVKRQIEWIKKQTKLWDVGDAYDELILHLLGSGEIKTAQTLLWTLAGFDTALITGEENESRSAYSDGVGIRIDPYGYAVLLDRVSPEFIKKVPQDFFSQLCGELRRFLNWVHGTDTDYDYSGIWVKDVAKDEELPSRNFSESLVAWIRNSGLGLASTRPGLDFVIEQTIKANRPVFRRIALHILSVSDLSTEADLNRLLSIEDAFKVGELEVEAWRAIAALWPSLMGTKDKILDRISAGPDIAEYIDRNSQRGSPPSREDVRSYGSHWRATYLNYIWDSMSDKEQEKFSHLEEEVLRIRKYVEEAPIGVFTPSSPNSREELEAMSDADLLELLSTWQPDPHEYWRDRDALESEWSEVIKNNPQRFSAIARSLAKLPHSMHWQTLRGFTDAIRKGEVFDLAPVLTLAESLLSANLDDEAAKDSIQMSLSLVEAILRSEQHWRSNVQLLWKILQAALLSESPARGKEDFDTLRDVGWLTVAINAPRSHALQLSLRLLLLLKRNENELNTEETSVLNESSEEVFRHLSLEFDDSLAVRAVFGQYFPWFAAAFKDRAEFIRDNTFPLEPNRRKEFESAWSTYLLYSELFNDTFAILRDTYKFSIENEEALDDNEEKVAFMLAWHAVITFLRGLEEYENSIAKIMLEKAGAKLLKRVLLRLGHHLREGKKSVPDDVKARFTFIWERAREIIESHRDGSYNEVAAAFGPWFYARLDPEWQLKNLEWVMSVHPRIEFGREVLKRLSELVKVQPRRIVAIAMIMAKNPSDSWARSIWKESVRTILIETLRSEDPETKAIATQLQDYLVRVGFVELAGV